MNNSYYDLTKLYYDYYGKYICDIPLYYSIKDVFEPLVAGVDIDKITKDLPYAHFDAETFKKSNERVINFTKNIMDDIKNRKYELARKNSAKSKFN